MDQTASTNVENVLFDSGAQISLIRSETAQNLGLKGRDISVNITKVGGEEETNQHEGIQGPSYSNRQPKEGIQ